ncbi:hypothetical protein [Methylobacterium organophilum]|uniref:hypothetical protein n=1 Tax=Methylobacterium organophilum TaxID=410 RepID=UPI001EE26F67|nr:hypothetical protein [Methylobacterium organophilum]
MTLAVRGQALSSGLVKREELETTVGMLNQRDLKQAAIALGSVPDLNVEDAVAVAEAVSRVIEPCALLDEAVPIPFVMGVLTMRPQLIENFDAARLDEDGILTLLDVAKGRAAVGHLIASLMSRPPSKQSFAFLERRASEAFVEAIGLSTKGGLHEKWRPFFSSRAREVIASGLAELKGSKQVGHAVALIDFSTEHGVEPSTFVEAASRAGPGATEAERADLDVYLLVLCRWSPVKSMKIIADILPRLRKVALDNGFSARGRALLERHLPYVSDSWDINKRLLKLVRNARRDGANIDRLVERMSLSKDELLYVFDEDGDAIKSLVSRLFWPFYLG